MAESRLSCPRALLDMHANNVPPAQNPSVPRAIIAINFKKLIKLMKSKTFRKMRAIGVIMRFMKKRSNVLLITLDRYKAPGAIPVKRNPLRPPPLAFSISKERFKPIIEEKVKAIHSTLPASLPSSERRALIPNEAGTKMGPNTKQKTKTTSRLKMKTKMIASFVRN